MVRAHKQSGACSPGTGRHERLHSRARAAGGEHEGGEDALTNGEDDEDVAGNPHVSSPSTALLVLELERVPSADARLRHRSDTNREKQKGSMYTSRTLLAPLVSRLGHGEQQNRPRPSPCDRAERRCHHSACACWRDSEAS